MSRRILVIKLGALGDIMMAFGVMRAIRESHKADHITLLTTRGFVDLAKSSPYFDDVMIDERPRWMNIRGWLSLRNRLNAGRFDRVYDLQNNDRTSMYLHLFSPPPEWVGAAPGASHRSTSPERTTGNAFEGHRQTMALAGIRNIEPDTLDWLQSDVSRFAISPRYALLVPGCSPKRPDKRWAPERFRAVAQSFIEMGIQPVLLGTEAEAAVNAKIGQGLQCLDLTGRTTLADIPSLARGAEIAVGNDSGPTHIIALTGCKTIMLFSTRESTIKKHGPIGAQATPIESKNLDSIGTDQVIDLTRTLLKP